MKGKNYPLYEVRTITSLKDMIEQSVSLYGNKNAFLVKREKNAPYTGVTFLAFDHQVKALGTAFLNMGLAGKKIAVIGENRYEWGMTYLAAVNGKSMIVPIDRELPAEDIGTLLGAADAACVVYSKKLKESVQAWKSSQNNDAVLVNMDLAKDTPDEKSLAALIQAGEEQLRAGDTAFDSAVIDPDEARVLLFTSGTTGLPKGVLLSHKNIVSNLMAMCQMTYIDEKDTFLSVLPLHHTYECTCGFLCQLYRGCTIAYCEGLKHILSNLNESRATMMLGVPAIFEAMYKRLWSTAKKNGLEKKLKTGLRISKLLRGVGIDVRRKLFAKIHTTLGGSVRLFISGAAAIDPLVAKGFRDFGIDFLQGYGITECAPIVALNRDYLYRDDAAGVTLPCMTLKILDPDSEGVGEIVCKGDNVMLGYYQNEEATKDVFDDGWFKTGDLGYLSPEGFLHITGRKKNVIVTKNGKNIYPEELETLLGRNPYVLECMVTGELNPEDGETYLCVQVLPNYEDIYAAFGDDFSKEEVKKLVEDAVREVNTRNPLYKHIRRVSIRETEFVKTTTRKIKRYLETNTGQK